jgi:hypothetical protein
MTPISIVIKSDDSKTLRKIIDKPSIVDWADETVGDTHIDKQKLKTITKNDKGKKPKRVIRSDESTSSPGHNQEYQESNDSTSATDDDDGVGRGSEYRIAPSSGGTQFIGEKHKLCYICGSYFFIDH